VAENNMDLLAWLRKQLAEAEPDLLREMVRTFAESLMGAEADALCGAGFRERTGERVNRRNGYRERPFDTRAGTIALAVPKLRSGSYFPDWLLERRRRAERALVAVVAECFREGRLHAPGRRPRQDARHRAPLEEPGLRDGQEPR
jgi:putative transposase